MTNKQIINALIKIVQDFHWMARRYADGRQTYAPSLFNKDVTSLLEMGIKLDANSDGTIWAKDGGGRDFDRLTDEQLINNSPAAMGDYIPLPRNYHLRKELENLAKDPVDLARKFEAMKSVILFFQAQTKQAKVHCPMCHLKNNKHEKDCILSKLFS